MRLSCLPHVSHASPTSSSLIWLFGVDYRT
jgi:hypothetical protein